MTPRELALHIEEYNHRKEQQWIDSVTTAYMTAAWQRAKQMPTLKKVLESYKQQPQKQQVQTPEQMLAINKQIHARMQRGG